MTTKNSELLVRRVEKILPSKDKLEKLLAGKKIRLYQGFDPTARKLHLGHTVGMRKLMDFADQGHEVIFLFGTGTVLVGDPSKRDTGRKLITEKEVEENIKDWKKQVSPIVDFNKVKVLKNGDWLGELKLKDLIKIASQISAIQLFKRESFQRRIKRGETIWYHETMYPLFQGYDSVVMDIDLEIGGTDQEFNMLVGRELQKKMNNKEKFVLTTPMIPGADGKTMSKTRGNCIWLDDSANNMFSKLMGVRDDLITLYMKLVSNISLTRIAEVEKLLESKKIHPMEAKKELAMSIISEFHGKGKADAAKSYFEKTFQKKELPKDVRTIKVKNSKLPLLDLVWETREVDSRSQIKRLINDGAVEVNAVKVTNPSEEIKIDEDVTIKIGKAKFVKIKKK